MLVREHMSRSVISTGPWTTIKEAAGIMADNHISCIVIERNESMVGILTERDVLRYIAEKKDEAPLEQLPISEIMTRYVVTVEDSATIESAVKTMIDNKIKKLPVMRNEKLVGIITLTDIASLMKTKVIKDLYEVCAKLDKTNKKVPG